jgi:hypothetical protein
MKSILAFLILLLAYQPLKSQIKFDAEQENFNRYRNSPCYNEIGFIPGTDNERLYKECEDRKWKQQFNHYLQIGLIVAFITLLFAFIIWILKRTEQS